MAHILVNWWRRDDRVKSTLQALDQVGAAFGSPADAPEESFDKVNAADELMDTVSGGLRGVAMSTAAVISGLRLGESLLKRRDLDDVQARAVQGLVDVLRRW